MSTQNNRNAASFVAQGFTLLYRRVLLCGAFVNSLALQTPNPLPGETRRYGRVKPCATALLTATLLALTGCVTTTPAPKNAPTAAVTLRDFKLVGDLHGDHAAFTLNATAHVDDARGGSVELLSGSVALTEISPHPKWRLRAEQNRFVATFDQAGDFPIEIKFSAAVGQGDGWNAVDFRIAPGLLQRVSLQGLAADTQFQFPGAARPERTNSDFVSFLPTDGAVKLAWKEARPETEGKLFYAAEMLSQITVSPGLMRQTALFDFKVMQGELSRVTLHLQGTGEITRVQGDQVLAWNVVPGTDSTNRSLVVQLNQPQKDQFAFQVQMQTPLGAFPQVAEAMQLRPENATRFAGSFRIVNEGAVRLEVAQASGLSQISPEQFPDTALTRAYLRENGSQRFAYRFSGADFALKIQADQILPELSVSEVLAYHLAENELDLDAEIELDIREAPLRELLLLVPKGWSLAQINAADYSLCEPADQANAELRLVFAQPLTGRQILQLRLEHNQALGEAIWALPRLEVARAKSVRGNVGVSADPGFRLTPQRTSGLTEIATAFFPRKLAGLQSAFRLSDADWSATLQVERLPQSISADAFHLFSIGEGIAYGSSLLNYVVSGAPVSAFRVELSDEYANVEFTGKDVRGYQKTNGGFVVQLHTPVAGAYTLLATYERSFKAQGDTLAFTGARPLDAQTEAGHTLVISAYQFQVKPANVSPGLLALETGEVPPEYRLFFDAPILAAYRYTSRPFNLQLALSPLAQGESIKQIVDRTAITNHIAKEGQVLTDVRYFVKNRGNPHLGVTVPDGTQLWSVTVNGAAVVPVIEGKKNLIPLPQRADPNAVLTLDLKLATPANGARSLTIAAPVVDAPVMLAEWRLEPDAGQRLAYRGGSLTPTGGTTDVSGFAGLGRMFAGDGRKHAAMLLLAALLLTGIAALFGRWTAQAGVWRLSARHVSGTLLGLVAAVMAVVALLNLGDLAGEQRRIVAGNLTFLAPVQQAGSALKLEIANLPEQTSRLAQFGFAWPAALALLLWAYALVAGGRAAKPAAWLVGWTLLAWTALRWPNGAPAFFYVLAAFLLLEVAVPALRRSLRLPRAPLPDAPTAESSSAPAIVALLLGAFLWLNLAATSQAAVEPRTTPVATTTTGEAALPELVSQQIRVEDKFALATVKIHWQAKKGQTLPLLLEPAVLTSVNFLPHSLQLQLGPASAPRAQQLLALEDGSFDIDAKYQVPVTTRNSEGGFALPTPYGLINRATITLVNLDVDVLAVRAVSIQRELSGTNTLATLVLAPQADAWIGWRPRSRDVKNEKAVFYAELHQLYVPAAGVVEGAHYAAIRPAQGELTELIFDIPAGATITDVIDPGGAQSGANAPRALVSLWRFDPDAHRLRVTLNPPQSRPFALILRSQFATGPLPAEQRVGLVAVENAAEQIGLLGVATGGEVQLDSVTAEMLSPINLEDFPSTVGQYLQAQIPGLTVHRAFRYSDAKATALLKASAVEPDVRVETQATLSLGEDRIVLAANATVDITKAGIFRLSFVLPAGMDVESVSGAALSHWTESKTDAGHVITLNLRGKTEGRQQFAVSLTGPGVKATNGWTVPQFVLREASKQNGSLLIVPEQGMRVQVAAHEGATQLDPQRSGIKQPGVLAFRVNQTPWNLSVNLDRVDPWIQVTSLQHATVTDAQVKIAANLQYQIENTGLKSFRVFLPTNAVNVRFAGDQVADFRALPETATNGTQAWEVKLQRRMIGQYLLQTSYQTPMPDQATETVLHGVQAADVNLQRGFVTIQAGGRLQVRVDAPPAALQPAEWQSIPRALQQDLPAAAANFAFRLSDPAFVLPLKLYRHEAAKLLPARVNNITFNSVISDDGVMLTQVRLEMLPGDKRLLNLTLPKDAKFWFAFVNQNGVWPWREQDRILIPLEQQAHGGKPIPVEIFYSSRIGSADVRNLNLALLAPKFDLPLENIIWHVYLNEKWHVSRWNGSLQLQSERVVANGAALDAQGYLASQATAQREQTREAEQMLAMGNTFLENGSPQQARRAFQNAYGLSRGDEAFNEDARVQLNNLKLQQALVGLNVRQATVNGESAGLTAKLRDARGQQDVNYTQQDAKTLIDRNSAEDNASFMKLAERLIQQQDAAVSSPAAIRASIPEQGRVLTFQRAVLVEPWADLNIGLAASAARSASLTARFLVLLGTLMMLALLAWAAGSFRGFTPRAGSRPTAG